MLSCCESALGVSNVHQSVIIVLKRCILGWMRQNDIIVLLPGSFHPFLASMS